MIAIAYYTAGTPYEIEVENLRRSLIQFDIKHDIMSYENRGSWVANCGIKPEFCLAMMERYPGEILMYVDADAVVKRPPVFVQDFKGDMAVHYRKRRELLSGTLVLKSTPRMKELMQRWVEYQKLNPLMWDQKTLYQVLQEPQWRDLEIKELPASYIKIFDAKDMGKNPVIEHYQASRRFKQRVTLKQALPAGVRVAADGSLFLARAKSHLITWLDARFQRIGKELRWMPQQLGMSDVCDGVLDGAGYSSIGYIVGKGPSLDRLSTRDFDDDEGPVIALNEAITVVQELQLPNQLFSIIDPPLKDRIEVDPNVTILSNVETGWYHGHKIRLTYSTIGLGLTKTSLTGLIAIGILKKMAVKKIVMLCFDACMGGELEYAKSVGYSAERGGPLTRFKKHRSRFNGALADIEHEFRAVVAAKSSKQRQP